MLNESDTFLDIPLNLHGLPFMATLMEKLTFIIYYVCFTFVPRLITLQENLLDQRGTKIFSIT